jgi:hypothetical protein
VLELVDLGERPAQRERQAVAGRGQPRREHLDERPVQPRGHRLRERRLARSRRTEQDDRTGRQHAVLLREVRVHERQDHPSLDELLLALHAGELLPQVARQHPAPEVLEQAHLLWLERHHALEVGQVARLVAAVAKRLHAHLALGQQRGKTVHPPRHQPLLELGQHRAPEPAPAPVVGEHQQDDPRTIAADARGGRPHDHLAHGHHDRGAVVAQRAQDLGETVHRTALDLPRLLPDASDLVEVVLVEVAEPGRRHAPSLPSAGPGRGGCSFSRRRERRRRRRS